MDMDTSKETSKELKPKTKSAKKRVGLIVMLVGILACIAGLVFLLMNIFAKPDMRDAEYLVEVGAWVRKDEPSVEWKFTEVGKGVLTTNAHMNDYDFIWALDEDTLKVETAWLYTLNDSFVYELNQSDKTLTLTKDEETIVFIPAEKPAENTEANEPDESSEAGE